MQEVSPFFESAGIWQIITGITAVWAVFATLAAPFLASRLTAKWQKDQEKNRLKLFVFGTLMQDRANPGSVDAVRAYNLIDALFHDTKKVREKWQEYYDSLSDSRLNSSEGARIRDDKRTALLKAMAEDLGLGKDFSSVDFSRVYYPIGLAEERELELLQQQVARHELAQRLNQQSLFEAGVPAPDSSSKQKF